LALLSIVFNALRKQAANRRRDTIAVAFGPLHTGMGVICR